MDTDAAAETFEITVPIITATDFKWALFTQGWAVKSSHISF